MVGERIRCGWGKVRCGREKGRKSKKGILCINVYVCTTICPWLLRALV